MILVLTIIFFLAIYFALSDIVIRLRPMPLSGALCVTFAWLIALESLILNGLSLFNAVNRTCLVSVHMIFLCIWFGWSVSVGRSRLKLHIYKYKYLIKDFWVNSSYRLLLPLLILLALTAWLYPPNNYDSLTYHMARVAHWMQNGSVEYYPTIINRQNEMGPGAEYIILFFQLLTGSDILANSVQLFSFGLLFFSLDYLLRILKISKKLSSLIIILCLTAPMAVLQATSTQNDLVATVIIFAIILSSRRLFTGNIKRMTSVDFVMIGIAMASGFLVKPTTLVIAAPLILIGVLFQLKNLISSTQILKTTFFGLMAALFMIALVAGPDIARKKVHNVSRHEVYPLFSQWNTDRFWNPVRMLGQNTPFPADTKKLLKCLKYSGNLSTQNVFNLSEDLVGNPFQFFPLVALALLTILLSPIGLIKPGYRVSMILSLYPLIAWTLFALIIRDNVWITRLQLPLFFLLPFSFMYVARIAHSKKMLRKVFQWASAVTALISLAYGTLAATNVPSRPLVLSHFWGERPSRAGAYYNNDGIKKEQDKLLKTAHDMQCKRIGLILGPDSVDYPLTWRAMQQGMETMHTRNAVREGGKVRWETMEKYLDWPCIVYADSGVIEHVPNRGRQWIDIGNDGHTFCRNLKYEFQQSKQSCLLIDSKKTFKKIKPMYEISLHTAPEGVILQSSGNDPHFLLPEISCGDFHHSVVLKMEMRSPLKTTLQLFYRTNIKDQFNEEQSVKKCIKQGDNTVYFQLPIDEIKGLIRIDPGMKPGEYKIYSLEARSIAPYTNDRNLHITTSENQ